ncbi:putative nucleic-acid-binding Zn-ribbon protein [Paenibacillus rhizosphaerae]|uniref:Putative nucleic-acid-binding Zn-ribbon protein n=1 Tax=Paenibacillus rhizosphaerae TaxID=297318 RepID=A0A839TVZ8_9BACL|nr:zinc ribbon domain-containing protein [Paenibacillus rhizosphaerae]MBB3129598.1 putative nucleic-acid-binding Zn-ribbon protein [Paenibacillus rhizosphaerae]
MTGTGLSKMFEIQHIHYLFVSCKHCGNVEVFNPDILEGKNKGQLGTILDILFES